MPAGHERTVALLVAIALLGVAAGSGSTAEEVGSGDYQVIVNPKNRLRAMERSFLRRAFLKKNTAWEDGETIRPIDLTRRFAARPRFAREVLQKTPSQLRAYWNQQIFSGKGVPPPEVDSEAAMIAYVLRTRGAVGYLPVGADPQGAVVVRLR
jgi:hypothetical protein